MKRLFAAISIGLALSASATALAFVPVARAQFEPPSGTVDQAAVAANAAKIQPGQGDVAGAQAAATKKALPPNTTPQSCSGLSTFSCVPGAIMTVIASLFAWLLGVAMIVLDASVYYTVVKMGSILSSANGITAIPLIWRVMRDFGNIALIFGFLAIGLETILGVDFYGGGTKLLPALVIVAVLLNFSLFFASAVVDVSNLFAMEFYSQINNNAIPAPPNFDNFTTAVHEEGVSNAIMSQLGMQTLYGAAMNAGTAQTGSSPSTIFSGQNSFFIGFLSSVLFIVAAFVMFSLSFILVTRFVVLIVLLVVSPIGVASFAIPQLKSLGRKWRDKLLEQSITAPVLILLLYVALRVITDVHFLSTFVAGGNSATAASNLWTGFVNAGSSGSNLTGFAGVFLSFLVAMGLLLAVTMAAKSMSAAGAGFATKVGGMATFGALAWGGRMSLGMVGTKMNSEKMRARAAGTGAGAFVARNLGVRLGRGMSNRTYDVRNVPGSKWVQGKFRTDAGKPSGLTANKMVESKFGLKSGQEKRKNETEEFMAAKRNVDFAQAQDTITEAQQKLKAGTISQADYDREVAAPTKIITDGLAKMSTKQLEELGGIKKGVAALVENLSPQKFDALMKSEKLTSEQREEIQKKRFATVTNLVTQASKPTATAAEIDAAKDAVAKISQKEIIHAGSGFLTNQYVAEALTNDQYDTISKDGGLPATEKAKIDAYRKNRFDPNASPTGAIAVAGAIKGLKWNRDAINKLPADTITNRTVLDLLGPDALNLIDVARRGNLNPTDREKLGKYVADVIGNPNDPRQKSFYSYVQTDPRVKRDLLIPENKNN